MADNKRYSKGGDAVAIRFKTPRKKYVILVDKLEIDYRYKSIIKIYF